MVTYVHEPDNHDVDPFAYLGTRGLDVLPRPRDGRIHLLYRLTWRLAFRGGFPQFGLLGAAGRVATRLPSGPRGAMLLAVAILGASRPAPVGVTVVKTVRVPFALPWVAEATGAEVLLVARHPLGMLAGWQRLGWGAYGLVAYEEVRRRLHPLGLWPPPTTSTAADVTWTLCALHLLHEDAARGRRGWRVRHEWLCSDPVAAFRELLGVVGLPWREEVAAFLAAADGEGAGWEVRRVARREVRAFERLPREILTEALPVLTAFANAVPATFAPFLAELDGAPPPRGVQAIAGDDVAPPGVHWPGDAQSWVPGGGRDARGTLVPPPPGQLPTAMLTA